MAPSIGFVGVGNMGSRMATNLLEAGFEVVVCDLDPDRVAAMQERGSDVAETPAEVAGRTNVIMTSLPTAEAIESAYLDDEGIIAGATPGSLLVDTSTTKPTTSQKVHERAVEAELTFVDAPVIGIPPVAERAELTFMVGGTEAAFERVRPILEHLGDPIYHVGSVGDGHRAKLLNNMVLLGNYALAAEALAFASDLGMDQQTMFDVIDSGMAGSAVVSAKTSKAFNDDFDPSDGMPIDKARKDLTYALDMGYEAGFLLPITAAIEEHYTMAAAVGRGHDDYSVLLRVLEDLTGEQAD